MPVEPFEITKLILGLIVLTIPGYLWSFYFSEKLKTAERIVFGFMITLGFLSCLSYILNALFKIKITQTLAIILYLIFSIPIFILFALSAYKYDLSKLKPEKINIKYVWLLGIIIFVFFMTMLPHIINNYYLPFHVDEWIHWSYTRSVIETGQTSFPNPISGAGELATPEIGFHVATANIKFFSGSTYLTIFLLMPSIISVFMALTAFNIGERSKRKYGLEAAFLIAFIPTTCRFLGPSFYVAVTMGLLILIFVIWLAIFKKIQSAILISAFIFFMFIVHPVTALAGSIILLVYSVFLFIDKQYKTGLWTIIFSVVPVIMIYYISTRWEFIIEKFLESLQGEEYIANLPAIWISFNYLSIITWALFIIGAYFSFTRGGSMKRTMSLSSIAFIIIIGLYYHYNYGLPIIYDRAFMYLYLLVVLVAAIGLSEIRRTILDLKKNKKYKSSFLKYKNIENILPIAIGMIIVLTAVPVHMDIGYYQLISEENYDDFIWLEENIEDYRDVNHSYDRAVVNPYEASAFAAITGISVVSSSMHPLYRLDKKDIILSFLKNDCIDTDLLNRYKASIVYKNIFGKCRNNNLTQIRDNIYIYSNLTE